MARVAALILLLSACHDPRADYDDFLARTSDGGTEEPMVQSRLADLNGRWLLHALLAGGLDLGLRVQLDMTYPALHARIWLATANPEADAPIVETDADVAPDGSFDLHAEPLVLGPDALKLQQTVVANAVLHALTLGTDAWCGTATGRVDQPLSLDLAGSTFAARRDDGKLRMEDVPQSCVPRSRDGKPQLPRPPSPDLSAVPSVLADLTGQFLLSAKLAGSLPQKLWLSLSFLAAPGGGGSLDGAIRHATDLPGTVALSTFSTTVTPDGRFEVWLPELAIGSVQGSVLLVAATLDVDHFCGAGAGHVLQPIDLDLAGTTFGAMRWTPGTAVPTDAPERCP